MKKNLLIFSLFILELRFLTYVPTTKPLGNKPPSPDVITGWNRKFFDIPAFEWFISGSTIIILGG